MIRTPSSTLRLATLAAMSLLVLPLPFSAEERIDPDVNTRIRQEGLERSAVMRLAQVLTDVYGPRLTGSPALREAGAWAVREMESWGLVNGRL